MMQTMNLIKEAGTKPGRGRFMGTIHLLDCTLRDGGYINDWQFGNDNLISIFERLADAGVEIIEVGFLDERRDFDRDRSIFPDTESIRKIYGKQNRKQAMVVGMIDYGTCAIDRIQPAEESYLDGIRVIFKKHLRREALAFCAELKALGYIVFAQLVSVTSYSEDELEDLARLANAVSPYAVSIVDTYGLMHQNNLRYCLETLNRFLRPEIGIGYHGHNNFQMAYANGISFLRDSLPYNRKIVVDGTLFGMGKSAGNTPVELLAMHLNQQYGKQYRIAQLLEAIDTSISSFTGKAAWGYDLLYFIAAYNDCHPEYVKWLINKRTLSIQSVNEILSRLTGERKLLYSESVIEQLYYDYLDVEIHDEPTIAALEQLLDGRKVLLLGPGNNIRLQEERIRQFTEKHEPVVISVNFIPEHIDVDYLFLSNAKRYVQLAPVLSEQEEIEVIATSNVLGMNGAFPYCLSFASLQCGEAEFRDNPFLMLLKVMIRIRREEVWLAGFDGYVDEYYKNYVDKKMEYHYSTKQSEEINRAVSQVLQELSGQIRMHFLTDTQYRLSTE